MIPVISAVFGFLGSAVKGLFNFKQNQTDVIQSAIKLIGDTSTSDATKEQAISAVLIAIQNNGSFLEKNWRPLFMVICMAIIISFWFGHVPPSLKGDMPEMVREIFDIIKIGLCGYIPARSLEKIVSGINLSGLLKSFIAKKVI
jgi:hypothetical protein